MMLTHRFDVHVKYESDKTGLGGKAVVPHADDELTEVQHAVAVLVEDVKHAIHVPGGGGGDGEDRGTRRRGGAGNGGDGMGVRW